MARPLRDPALRDGKQPLGADELLRVRARVADELIVAATSRRVDIGEVRKLGRVAALVDQRLSVLADRGSPPSLQRRQEIAAGRSRELTGRR